MAEHHRKIGGKCQGNNRFSTVNLPILSIQCTYEMFAEYTLDPRILRGTGPAAALLGVGADNGNTLQEATV
jgi:hypothetical protein